MVPLRDSGPRSSGDTVMRLTTVCLAFLFSASMVAALPVEDGTYEVGGCSDAAQDDSRVTIDGDTVTFWESTCVASNAVNVRDMGGAQLFDMICSGEGEAWTRRMMFLSGPNDRMVIVQPGFATTYTRCD